eukprot:4057837-Pleurochrysis_carterae.AAC.4
MKRATLGTERWNHVVQTPVCVGSREWRRSYRSGAMPKWLVLQSVRWELSHPSHYARVQNQSDTESVPGTLEVSQSPLSFTLTSSRMESDLI